MIEKQSDEMIATLYGDGSYLENNKNWHQEDSPYKVSFIEKIIQRNNLVFDSCADVGCGAGLVTELLAQKLPNVKFCGYDLSDDAKVFWKQRSPLSNLAYRNKDPGQESDVFDVVICLDVFEHIEDFYGFLRSLKSSGKKFIFNVPLDMNVMKVLIGGLRYAREEVGHLHYFNEYTALKTLEDCGYIVKDSFLSAAFIATLPRNYRQLAILPIRLITLIFGKSIGARLFGGMSMVVLAE